MPAAGCTTRHVKQQHIKREHQQQQYSIVDESTGTHGHNKPDDISSFQDVMNSSDVDGAPVAATLLELGAEPSITAVGTTDTGHNSSSELIIHHTATDVAAHSISELPDTPRSLSSTLQKKPKANKKKISQAFSRTPIKFKKEFDPDNSTCIKKRFCSSWFNIPEIAPWLEESILPHYAYCKFCQKDLTAGKSELYKHLRTVKHRKKAELYCESVNDPEVVDPSVPIVEFTEGKGSVHIDNTDAGVSSADSVPRLQSKAGCAVPRKFYVYLADDMHVPQSKDVMEAAYNATTEQHRGNKLRELEYKAAALLGKEAALFVLTGTMANTLAVLAHCRSSNSVILAGDRSHLYRSCQATLTRLQHISIRALRNERDGRVNLEELRDLMMLDETGSPSAQPAHHPCRPKLLCLENTHTYSGGTVLPQYYMQMISKICDEFKLKLHIDGARLLHAAYASGLSPAELAAPAHSVTLCMNKGLDVHNGSVIAGDKEFINRCRELSGLFCTASVKMEGLAAACSKALSHYVQHVARAHLHAKNIVRWLSRFNSSAVSLSSVDSPTTNMLLLECDCVRVTPEHLVERLRQIPSTEVDDLKERISIIAKVWSHNTVRLVTHSNLAPEQLNATLKKLKYVIEEYENYIVLEYNMVD
uniref:Low-specificity L-threonine aldolase 2 n=1 Tax=Hirondellea gigas TaxID=1518452 RepID=A0A6A7FUR3_9CRUS